MAACTETIGSSLLEYIDNKNSSPAHEQMPRKRDYFDSTSALLAAVGLSKPAAKPRRYLVRGPPKSGRTSLALDMAYAIAASSNPPCSGKCGRTQKSCQCVGVVMVVNAKKTKDFPLPCRRHVSSKANDDLEAKLLAIEGENKPISWNEQALRRIQVEHVATRRALLEYLLSMQTRPKNQQPWGAVILDDVEFFVQSDNTARKVPAEQLILPIFAVLADTVNTLERVHPSITLCATMDSSTGFPSNVERIFANHMPFIVSLGSSSQQFSNMLEEGDSVESSWIAKQICPEKGATGSSFPYNIVRESDGSFRILWSNIPLST